MLIQENQRLLSMTKWPCSVPCPSHQGLGHACSMCTGGAALLLSALAISLLISSGQQAVREAAANWQLSHQLLANGQNPTGHLLAGPFPTHCPLGTPTCQGHCLPGPCRALIGRSHCARLGGRCWALLRPQGLEPGTQTSQGRTWAWALAQQTWV